MGIIINPRGSSGSGKTELVRRTLQEYRWNRGGAVEPIHCEGRKSPLGYRLSHPYRGPPLAVLGHYEATSGGADTIRMADGGMTAIMRFADEHASAGYDVLMEGLRLGSEHELSTELARSHSLHVLRLTTPQAECVSNLISRRRASRSESARFASNVAGEQASVEVACRMLEEVAQVEALGFDAALARLRSLLRLDEIAAAA